MIKLHLPKGKLLIGLSGGADSVALLLLLLDSGAEVAAVHVNHGLRGEASDEDESFVRGLCAQLDVTLLTFRACPPENPGENWAREVRYGFFRQAIQETGADALVLAHHRDDQAETMLLHLLRGAGLTGLAGMAADSELAGMRILRPLLAYSREELRAYLNERNQPWREDASNGDSRYLRNALRGEVLPLLNRLAPGAAERMAVTASLLREDEAVLQSVTNHFLAENPGDALPLAALQRQPAGLQKRILRTWWTACAAPREERSLSAAQTNALCGLVNAAASTRCNLPGGWYGQRGWTHLHLIAPENAQLVPEQPAKDCPLLCIEAFNGETCDGKTSQALPGDWLKECTVRSRRPGDFIRPFGSAGRQSLQDYFVNHRVDAPFRDCVPLLCRGSEVLLAGGVGAGGIPRAEEINAPVLLRWKVSFPWQREHQE
nr:tRNA lysidine(34) synthetase TilS [Clostridia bacterium]